MPRFSFVRGAFFFCDRVTLFLEGGWSFHKSREIYFGGGEARFRGAFFCGRGDFILFWEGGSFSRCLKKSPPPLTKDTPSQKEQGGSKIL